MTNKKRFRLFDAILAVICVVFVAEAAAPAAAIGNTQYFWWVFLIIAFLLPYGLVVSELGTTYEDEGGLYDWVRRAFGPNWAARVSWYYWINFPLWIASLAILFPETIDLLTGAEMPGFVAIAIELAFIWIVTVISFFRVSDSKWVLNISAILKVLIALILGGLGVWAALTHGVANEFTLQSMIPTFNANSLGYLSIILFNFMGFEVITTFASDMDKPRKQIPQAIIAGGLAIAAIYLFSAFGIGVAIPVDEISTSSGLIEAVQILTGNPTGLLVTFTAVVFLITLFGNMVSWSYGVNYVASHAAKQGDMPKIFSRESKRNGMPVAASIINAIIASVLILVAQFIPSKDLFWSFFALNIVMLLMAYIPMFPAFIQLRKTDPDAHRPYKVSGGKVKLSVIAFLPAVLLVLAIIATAVPLDNSPDELSVKIPVLVGTIIAVVLGEIVRITSQQKYNNLKN